MQPILQICPGEIRKELIGAVVGDGEHEPAGLVGNGLGKMSFACPGGPEEDDSLAPLDEPAGGKAFDELGIDGRIKAPVKSVDRCLGTKAGPPEETFDPSGGAQVQFVGHEHREELGVGEIVGAGFHDASFKMFPDAGKLQEPELVQELVVHDASP